jgi:TolA-binding protein
VAKDRNRAAELKQRLEEATTRYQEVVEKYPEFDRVAHAKLGVGVCQAQLGNLDAAIKALEGIPGPDRSGELGMAAYLLADCLIRVAPTKAEDALQENQMREKLTAAVGMLDGFVAGNPKAAEAPAALLKLGYCQKRLGAGLADPNERNQTLQKAREAYEKLVKDYPKDPLAGQARLEAQKVRALQGDRGGAMNELRGFLTNGATSNDRVAPLALLHLATLYREQNQPAEAAKVLDEHRKRFEPELAKDPERAEWVGLLKYHHGLAVFETQKYADARKLFDEVIQQNNGKPVAAEAALRSGQCKLQEAKKAIQDGQQLRNQAGNDQNKKNQADQKIQQGRNAMLQAADELVNRADQFRPALPTGDGRARMLYDAAWAYRELGVEDVAAAREHLRREAHGKLVEEAKKKLPPNAPPPNVPVPEIDRASVPVQRGEDRALNAYKKLFDEFPDAAIGVDARLELAEMRAERNEHSEIVKVLKEALDKEPTDRPVPADTVERVRLRLGASLYAVNDFAAAASQFEGVASNPKSPYFAQALYRCGESLFAQGEYAKAVEKLSPFRDKGELHNVGGISDRAMLRLGFALIAAKNPEAGRQALETMLQRFGAGNPFAAEARFGFAQALFAQGKIDEAVKGFEAVIAATRSDLAARAQMEIGRCRMTQKKFGDAANAFLVVPYTYDYPELANAAILEAARAFEDDKQSEQAKRLLTKLMKDTPADSEWHKAAKDRLGKLKK